MEYGCQLNHQLQISKNKITEVELLNIVPRINKGEVVWDS
nr:MAG TPA: hypothetical protein [Caudoviricetes sp.]DAN64465.1 MAG TPA: hypothetical protein [Caudoviricetes sp.]